MLNDWWLKNGAFSRSDNEQFFLAKLTQNFPVVTIVF